MANADNSEWNRAAPTFTFIDLFAGIGGMRIAFERAGGRCVFSSDIDEHCQKTYEANFGEKPVGDIKLVEAKSIPDHDVLVAGFPCQPFSIIGNGQGFTDTRGTLFFDIERILKEKRPKAFLLENVRRLTVHDKRRTLRTILNSLGALGYDVRWKVLDARNFGLPQKRERVFIIGFLRGVDFQFPLGTRKKANLADFIEKDENVDRKYFASENIVKKRKEKTLNKKIFSPAIWHENKGGNIGINDFACALRAGGSYNYLLVNGIRRLTPRECLRLQGFPDSFKIVVGDGQTHKQAGNSVPIPVVEAIAKRMISAMETRGICYEKCASGIGKNNSKEQGSFLQANTDSGDIVSS